MKKKYFFVSVLALALAMPGNDSAYAQLADGGLRVTMGASGEDADKAPMKAPIEPESILTFTSTGQTKTFTLTMANLTDDVELIPSFGFEVFPTVVPVGTATTPVAVTYTSYRSLQGRLVIRSGNNFVLVDLAGTATPLEEKDLSQTPVYQGASDPMEDGSFETDDAAGFTPGDKGYTVEFKVRTAAANQSFDFSAILKGDNSRTTGSLAGYVTSEGLGLYSSNTMKYGISNPYKDTEGGNKNFYNNDGKYHTYRYAVTPERRIFVYRDGLFIDQFMADSYTVDPDTEMENGEYSENLLVNGDFQSEFIRSGSDSILSKMHGWQFQNSDRWNGFPVIEYEEYGTGSEELPYQDPYSNYMLKLKRETWATGWGAIEAFQIVDVAPGETYALSALVKGGKSKEERYGKMIIAEEQNKDAKVEQVVSNDGFDVTNRTDFYSLSYTPSANCKQLRVTFYLEKNGWGQGVDPLVIDNVKLEGVARTITEQTIGFENSFSEVAYFTYDVTGAYAPLLAGISTDNPPAGIGTTNVTDNFTGICAEVNNNMLFLKNIEETVTVQVYDTAGKLISSVVGYVSGEAIPLNERGVFICVIDNGVKKQNLKVVN